MTLTSALSKAVQGLNMAARGTDVVSANIANAQTAGYVRRQIESQNVLLMAICWFESY